MNNLAQALKNVSEKMSQLAQAVAELAQETGSMESCPRLVSLAEELQRFREASRTL